MTHDQPFVFLFVWAVLLGLLPQAVAQVLPPVPLPRPDIGQDRIATPPLSIEDQGTELYWRFTITTRSGQRIRTDARRERGRITVEDPQRFGSPRRVDYYGDARLDWAGLYYVDEDEEVLLKRVVDVEGDLLGVVGAHANGVYAALDTDADGNADLFQAQRVDGVGETVSPSQTLLATDAGLQFLNDRGGWDTSLICGPSLTDLGAVASDPQGFLALGASATLCPESRADRKGGGRFGNNPATRLTETAWDRLCADQESTLGSHVSKDPRKFHWGDAFLAVGQALNPIPTTVEAASTAPAENAGIEAIGRIVGVSIGWAVNTTKAIGAFLEGGRGEFVNDADRILYGYEQAVGEDGNPDPDIVEEACAAGSSSPYCGGGAGRAPGSQPIPGEDNSLAETCEARREAKWRQRSYTQDTRYVREECENPAEQPRPARSEADGVTLRTFCGGEPEPGAPDLGDIVGGNGCPPTATPLPDGTCGNAGVPSGTRQRLHYGYLDALGLEMRLRPCPDAICAPPEQ